jgi:hypothetical protein
MPTSTVIRFSGFVLLIVGFVFLNFPGKAILALGAVGPMPATGANDGAAMAFWRQLAFMRMFGAALIGLAAISFWAGRQLTEMQRASLVKVLMGAVGLIAGMAVMQQVAIWSGHAGWWLVGVFCTILLACLASVVSNPRKQIA